MANNIYELLNILIVGSIVVSYLLASLPFVFRPLAGSPLHFTQNLCSCTFKLAGALPPSDEPGISASTSFGLFETELIVLETYVFTKGKASKVNNSGPTDLAFVQTRYQFTEPNFHYA